MAAGIAALTLVAVAAGLVAYRLRRERNAVREQLAQARQTEQDRQSFSRQMEQTQRLESVGRLAGGVAHDFNNLLTVINGYSDLILKRMQDDPWRRQVEGVRSAGARAADVTRQLLAFSRKQVLLPKMLLLNDLVRDAEGALRASLGDAIDLILDLDPGLRPVEADPVQMNHVIVNLAANARDAMPSGGRLTLATANAKPGEVCLSCANHAGHGRFVVLSVADTGVGMDAATLEHAFEPFFTNKGAGKGSGLGLATVYGIVKQSEGHIGIESSPGHGARFTIHLPAIDRLAEEGASAGAAVRGGTESLLLVLDEADAWQLLGAILGAQGYRTLRASDGREALQLYAEEGGRVDLLIADAVLPGISRSGTPLSRSPKARH